MAWILTFCPFQDLLNIHPYSFLCDVFELKRIPAYNQLMKFVLLMNNGNDAGWRLLKLF